jgi:polysaccharide biosynthesis transport protein
MAEELLEQPTQQFDLARILGIVRRRHLYFLISLFVGWLVIWGSSWFMAPRYRSSTLILVEQPTMPKNYVEPNVNDDLQDRLQSITEQILSRTRLLYIIDKLHLYNNERGLHTPDEKVARMRKDTDIELVRDGQNQAITAFRVSFSAGDAHVAQAVTGELTNLFIDENSRVREQESENTTQFMENQLASARTDLAEQDAKVRAFQAAHEGELPNQEASNLQILNGLQQQLQGEQDSLNTAKEQRVYTQTLVDQYRTIQGPTRNDAGAPVGLAGIDQQLNTLRAKLADLSTRYTDLYPEVQQVKAEIAKAEKERDQFLANLKSKGSGAESGTESAILSAADPAQAAPLLQLQGQLQADQLEITNRERSIASLKSRINEYQNRLSEEPAVEQELADLTRGYNQSQENYNDLLKKENDSQMATSMEHLQEGERFTPIDPPNLPIKPDFPNRLKMSGTGLGVGLALGILVVAGCEFFDDRLYSDKEIQHILPVAVLAEVPEIATPADERRTKKKVVLGWSVAAAVFVVILAGTAISFLHA